ncbi:MAG: UDP-N-acetylmuramoyl-L-alanyl-D-glutamate--2,6-diaminopimelate ligase [Chloroflexota bacterium]
MDEKNTRQLKQLLAAWQEAVAGTSHPHPPVYDGLDVTLTRLTEKTGDVDAGACFVARVRTGSDGHPYIGKAIERGARAILAQRPSEAVGIHVPEGVAYLVVEDTAVAEAWLAAAWEGFPSRQLVMVGITGTDGKTTTANFLFSILRTAGIKAGLLSTIKAVIGEVEEPLEVHVTTPEAPVIQRHLRRMADAGLTHCILEVTSHGLAQERVGAIDFDMAAVTNITHEHLDYHGSYEAYFTAKQKLFAALLAPLTNIPTDNPAKLTQQRTAVLNRDDGSYSRLSGFLSAHPVTQLTYGLDLTQDVFATDIVYGPQQTTLNVGFQDPAWLPQPVATPLVGEFNVYNMLAASAVAKALRVPPEAIGEGLSAVHTLSGRMERIDEGQPFLVVVDFAHTPNALERAIGAARRMTSNNGRVVTVFGSAGKRDVDKRRLMAEVSARDADLTVLTAEDPRTESLDEILTVMAAAAESQGGVEDKTFWRIRDRGEAIYFALGLAVAGDVVLVCGKGHEQSMCFGVTEYPWDDRTATRAALSAYLAGRPMVDLGLPTYESSE